MEPIHCFARSNSSLVLTLLVLFDITSEQSVELKWLMLNKLKKMISFVTCEVSLGQYVCELVFGVDVLDMDFWVQNHWIE